jgi:tRNA pseudouridine38-40 synthase
VRNIRLIIQYDGTNYSGWQLQPRGVTIQGLLERCLSKITGDAVNVVAAGRTDAGVHALGQCANFNTGSLLTPEVLRDALNAHLPHDIRIMLAEETEPAFNARFSATGKSYVYIVSTSRIISPFLHRYLWRLPYGLDLKAMRDAAMSLAGTHDFSAFRGSGCGAKTAVRTISSVLLEKKDEIEFLTLRMEGDFIIFRFEGNAFLRHMVRNMVGTLVEVGRSKIGPADIMRILESGDRKCAGPTAPPQGLFLERINYP